MTEEEPYQGPPPMVRPGPLPWQGPPPSQPPIWQQGDWTPPPWQQPVPPWMQPRWTWGPAPIPPEVRWAPPPGTPPHDVPRPYLHAMRTRDWAWWRPLLGLLLIAVVYAVAATVVVLVTFVTGAAPDFALLDLIDPVTLLVTNLSLIVAVPVVWLAWVTAHGMRIGWSSSVLARFRWRLVLPYVLIALLTLGTGIGLAVVVGFAVDGEDVTGPVSSFGWLLLVVVLTTPLQSAAEEYLFRGYLSQAIAGWFRAPRAGAVAAAVLTAALFSLAHAPPDAATFLDRFAFGLAASAVVWLTGGLEAAVVLHAVNNVLVFFLAGALGSGVATEEVPADAGLWMLLLSLLSMAAYVGLVGRSRRRLHPETVTAAQDLRFPGTPVPVPAA